MNFERLADRIVSTAEKARTAAQSFKGLDALAAQDEYIHSDGLNVRRKEAGTPQSKSGTQQSSSQQDRTTLSPVTPQLTQPQPRFQSPSSSIPSRSPSPPPLSDSKLSRHHMHADFNRSQSMPIDSSATDRSKRSTKRQETMPLMSSRDDSDSEEDRSYPIQAMNVNAAHQPELDSYSASEHSQERQKNTKRFLEDLEDRMSRPMKPMPIDIEAPATPLAPEQPSSSWLWVGLSNKNASSQSAASAPAPLLARTRRRSEKQFEQEENFHLVTSSTMLADEELAQLQAFETSSAELSGSWTSRLWVLIREHPRESFVVATLLLGLFAYFYSWTVW